ncbi:hypothetical protein I6A84_16580, partial [Frankia sp. CNm7]|nr:hypothetical protein [Frankia nepalensis]
RRLARPDILARLSKPDDSRAVAARRRLAELQGRLSGFYTNAAAGRISAEGLAAIEAELLPQITAAQTEADTVTVPLFVVRLVAGQPGEKEIRARVEALPVTTRRTLYRLLFEWIRVKPAGGKRGVAGVIDVTRLDVRWRKFQAAPPAAQPTPKPEPGGAPGGAPPPRPPPPPGGGGGGDDAGPNGLPPSPRPEIHGSPSAPPRPAAAPAPATHAGPRDSAGPGETAPSRRPIASTV